MTGMQAVSQKLLQLLLPDGRQLAELLSQEEISLCSAASEDAMQQLDKANVKLAAALQKLMQVVPPVQSLVSQKLLHWHYPEKCLRSCRTNPPASWHCIGQTRPLGNGQRLCVHLRLYSTGGQCLLPTP